MNTVEFQIQDVTGNWLSLMYSSSNTDMENRRRLAELAIKHPNKRIRAIDSRSKRVIDIL